MANKTPLKRYYDLVIGNTEKFNELNLTEEQAKFLGADYFSKISTEERKRLNKLESDTQKAIVSKYFEENPPRKKESAKPKQKRKTKAQIAAEEEFKQIELQKSEEEQKKFLHLEDDFSNLKIRFIKYATIYTTPEIDKFKENLTQFQNDIDKIIKDLKQAEKEAEQNAAIAEFKALQDAINEKAEQLKKLGVPVQVKEGKIIINE